jgi:Secretion system C-terminal sorting domain
MKALIALVLLSLTISAYAQPVVTHTTPLTFCNGDSVVLQAEGYTNVIWLPVGQTTNTIAVYEGGTYRFIVNPGTVSADTSNTVTVTVNPNPQETVVGDYVLCGESCAMVSAPPGYANYLWSNGDTTQTSCCPTHCDVIVTNEYGCSSYGGGFSVEQGWSTPITITFEGSTLVVSPAVNCSWSFNNTFIPNWNNSWYTPTQNGSYKAQYSSSGWFGCTTVSNVYVLTNVGVAELDAQNIEIFPNPVDDVVSITNYAGGIVSYTLYNQIGQTVTQTIQGNQVVTNIDLSGIKAGVYFLRMEKNGKVAHRKIIKA